MSSCPGLYRQEESDISVTLKSSRSLVYCLPYIHAVAKTRWLAPARPIILILLSKKLCGSHASLLSAFVEDLNKVLIECSFL